MIKKENLQGVVLQCNEIGVVEKVIRDDFHLCKGKCIGKSFSHLFHTSMITQALDFLMQIKNESFAFDHWLALSDERPNTTLYFSGFFLEHKVWIIGAGNSSAMLSFINQLQQINNEQTNQIRTLVKQRMDMQPHSNPNGTLSTVKAENDLLVEMSGLNNELVNLQREMAKKNAEMARLNELKNQFLGMAAHDLRNPLGNIMALADFLIDETKEALNEEQQEFLTLIATSAEFMLSLIEDLLDITKIESGKLNLNLEEADLVELTRHTILFNNAMAARKGVSISLENGRGPLLITMDKQKIEQVMNNLLSNAVKFSYPDSQVLVKITCIDKKVLVEVIDQGTGIPTKHLETIFKPFNKVSGSGTGGEKSTGLGLSIVKKIIEGHNGVMGVNSEEGRGSRFYFELPLNDAR
jgi:two-component system, OmpR family, sensor kinase